MTWLVLSAAALGGVVVIASVRAVIVILSEVAQDRIDSETDGQIDHSAQEARSRSW
ncbi:hypothetical protein [Cryobacterium zhongshanensis]|uniref:Uncharacterized protein n=1 Tax=Cryobacterium zhongshanensis TaxID=2928153 RepID=A0AA41R061_9MICO|nr:hypothetical protein [Cryobacterium zhongshanensis]MCI4660063.1 hypothetical protein [Cryobacterium zhongshanensis]